MFLLVSKFKMIGMLRLCTVRSKKANENIQQRSLTGFTNISL